MFNLIKQFAQIAFLTGKPYDLPGDSETLRIAAILAFLSYVLAASGAYGLVTAFFHALVDITLSGLVLYVALSLAGKTARFAQSFAAYCGASSMINLAQVPVIYTSNSGQEVSIVHFVFLVWSISVLGHVIRHTFDTNIPISIVASMSYVMFSVTVFMALFPG